jgi:Uri superfamily endonuclease
MSAGVKDSLRDGKNGRSWEALVGYTVRELMQHLERQFVKTMSWSNRHKWHIDHIQPLASFTFTSAEDPEFQAAWALTNLRPLWKPANLSKSGKRTLLL